MSYEPFFAATGAVLKSMEQNKAIQEAEVRQAVDVCNMSPIVDRWKGTEIQIKPGCLLDSRMHVHVRTSDGNVEFWLEENNVPKVSIKEKDVSLPDSKAREIAEYVNARKGNYILKWIDMATQAKYPETERNLPRWRALAKNAGYLTENDATET